MTKRPARRAFTLIELLVVVAIITLLVSILAPGLRASRDTGRLAVCASNVRQLMIASTAYADDARGLYAPGASDMLRNLTRWHGSRDHPSSPFHASGGALSPYLDLEDSTEIGVRTCPSFAGTLQRLADQQLGFERSCGGYGYNNTFVGVQRRRVTPDVWTLRTDRAGSPASAFGSPSCTIGFADGAFGSDQGVDGLIEYSFIEPRFWPDTPSARADPSMHFRHQQTANIAWLDGHVSPAPMSFSWTSGLYGVDPAIVHVGWFGQSDNNSLFDYQ